MTGVSLTDEHMNPPLMAIGDSMYQGVRSLTMSADLFRYSPPAQVARALEFKNTFSYPQPERPLFMDMEAFIRLLPDLGAIDHLLAFNAEHWSKWWNVHWDDGKAKPGDRLTFENLAVASMDISDLYAFDWDLRVKQAQALIDARVATLSDLLNAPIPGPPRSDGGTVADAILGVNACLTLNPLGRPDLRGVQPMDLVKARKPQVLLINIGSNEGLFETGFNGKPTLNAARVSAVITKYTTLAEHLAELGTRTTVIINNLVLPSQMPNLMPAPESITYGGHKPRSDGYYDNYENRMGFTYGTMTGDQLKEQDERVREINAGMHAVMTQKLGDKVHIIDMAGTMADLNHKHARPMDDSTIKVKPSRFANVLSISNMMIESDFGSFARGGFCGLDGMHPSVVGYARIAKEVLRAIGRGGERIDYVDCFNNDTLLTDLPGLWTLMMFLYRDYRCAAATPETEADKARVKTIEAACCTAPRSTFHPVAV